MDLKNGEKAVVVESGRTIVSTHDTAAQAQTEADRRRKLQEGKGEEAQKVEVKQQIFG